MFLCPKCGFEGECYGTDEQFSRAPGFYDTYVFVCHKCGHTIIKTEGGGDGIFDFLTLCPFCGNGVSNHSKPTQKMMEG